MSTPFADNVTIENVRLPDDFVRRMQALLDAEDYNAYLNALKNPPLRFARKNPQKAVDDALLLSELGGYPIIPADAKPGKSPLHAAGAYYVQEPAAAAVAGLLAPLLPPSATVLDVCAAPGGKVTAAACTRPDCTFLANEIVFARAKILLSNIERLGLRNCTVTSLRPDEVAKRASGIFDAVIADVPCSGEGMLRKTEFGSQDLSDESVAACALRAEKILDACDRCLTAGGILLFSTCTFNRRENEEQVARLVRERGYVPVAPDVRPNGARAGFDLPEAVRFFPQDGEGEGHFACLLRKESGESASNRRDKKSGKNKQSGDRRIRAALQLSEKITQERFAPERVMLVGDGCEYVAENYPFAHIPALRRGMRMADFANERAVPHHHFATAARPDLLLSSPDFTPVAPEIAAYLQGREFICDAKDGFGVVRVAGLPLGLIKVSGGVAKNHYPKGLRI